MDFSLSREQIAIKKMMRQFFESKVAPYAEQIDEEGHIPEEVIADLKKMKLFGMTIEKKFGGSGGSPLDLFLVLEELGKVSAGISFFLGVHSICPTAIQLFGTEDQKKKYLPRLCSGEAIGSFSFTEATTGSNPKAITTTATEDNGGYRINGTKRFSTNPNFPGIMVVFAKTGNGLSSFIVDKQQEGYSISTPWKKMGCRGAGLHDVYLKDVHVNKEDMLGQDGKGFNILLKSIAVAGKLGAVAMLLGIGGAALEEAIKYAQDRTVNGKPIAGMQSIQAMVASSAAKIEASRYMGYRFATLVGQGVANIEYEAALTKLFVAESIREAVNNCLQVHGPYGYIKDFKIERLYRDIRLGEVVEGVSEVQKAIVGGTLLKK